jgi:hypothetical protein
LVQTQRELQQAQARIAVLQTALRGVVQAAAQVPQVVPVVPWVAVFEYSPATMGAAALINYNTANGAKVQKTAVEKLHVEHHLDKSNLHDFLEALRSRAISCGWNNTLLTVISKGAPLRFVDNYWTISKEDVDAPARTYMFHDMQAAQDSFNLFICLKASLTTSARTALYAESSTYTYQRGDVVGAVQEGDAEERRQDELMFLWAVINQTISMTTEWLSVLLDQIFNLPGLMQGNNHDVQMFNTQIRKLLNMYYENKRQTFDETVLLNSLAKAYLSCKDEEFVMYIKRKWSDHQDNTIVLTSTHIMEFALKQYQTANKSSACGVNSKQSKLIMNLTAQAGEMTKWRNDKSTSGNDKKDDTKSKKP